jgi:hypothetical protein
MDIRASLRAPRLIPRTPCKPSEHVRHRGDDRRAHEDSNPGAAGGDEPLPPPGQDLQCFYMGFLIGQHLYKILINNVLYA